ncbi:Ribonuclease Z (EC [Olavius algarvensis associated proteobacterium Delta 3]|nr:Ribonuclease Z (EC [Olavius algarvensis associated proteobacterium Delta 3]
MNIKILGNGGAINDGLPYNSFVINETLLCETPPDIMLSLHRNSIDLASIHTIYISHLHGDHLFGLPFLILSAFFSNDETGTEFSFEIIGPKGLEKMCENLVVSAFTSNHPCIKWMKEFCTFLEINETSKPKLVNGFETTIFKLDHLIDTYGLFLAREGNSIDFAYVADTRWCESLHRMLTHKPQVVLIDLNGTDSDPVPVHLSIKDLQEKAIPITGEKTTYFGTHLKKEFHSTISCVRCAKPGDEINL